MLSSFIACAALLSPASQIPEGMKSHTLAILVTGSKKADPAEAGKLQAEHLKFLKGLWEERKALAVGPFTNGKEWRGLVVLETKDEKEAREILSKDPFVSRGILDVLTFDWLTMESTWGKGKEFMDLAEYRFAVLRRPKDAKQVDDDTRKKWSESHMANINKMAKDGLLIAAGPILNGKEIRGIFVLQEKDEAKIKAAVQADALISNGLLEMQLITWYTSKGNINLPKIP